MSSGCVVCVQRVDWSGCEMRVMHRGERVMIPSDRSEGVPSNRITSNAEGMWKKRR